MLVADETGFLKKGTHSAGVARQYGGTAGKVDTCQVGVFVAYASRLGQTLLDRALYLPQSWTEDAARCRLAGIDAAVGFAAKCGVAVAADASGRVSLFAGGRSLKTQALTACLVFAPRETTLQRLVWVAGRRWCIEVCFESAKQDVGLDDYEVRSWQGWHRHVTVSTWALALLVAVRAAQGVSSGVEVPGKKVMLTGSLSGFGACPVLDTGASRGRAID